MFIFYLHNTSVLNKRQRNNILVYNSLCPLFESTVFDTKICSVFNKLLVFQITYTENVLL